MAYRLKTHATLICRSIFRAFRSKKQNRRIHFSGLVHNVSKIIFFRRTNYTPDIQDLSILKSKLNSAKREFPMNKPVRILIKEENTKRKISHNPIWSRDIYFITGYKCPLSPDLWLLVCPSPSIHENECALLVRLAHQNFCRFCKLYRYIRRKLFDVT